MTDIKNTFDTYIKEPNNENKNKVVEASIPIINNIVKKFQNGKIIEKNDLFQEGVYGVLRAMSKANSGEDLEKKIFSYIKASILNYSRNQSPLTLNNYAQDKCSKINNFIINYTNKYEKEPTDQEISEALHIKTKNLAQFKAVSDIPLELNENIEDENDDFYKLKKQDDINHLLSTINTKLNPKEREIILMKYGINQEKPMTLEEIGTTITPKLCKQRIDQIHKSILLKLRKYLQD